MESNELDSLIEELAALQQIGATHGWKSFWDKAHEIQAGFNAKPLYPTKQLRDEAWNRFNALRNEAAASRAKSQLQVSTESRKIDARIDDLEEIVKSVGSPFSKLTFTAPSYPIEVVPRIIYDWRPVWPLMKEIQALFSSGVRYPTKSLRDEAWTRFNNLRNEVSQQANAGREAFFNISKAWCDEIIRRIESTRYSQFLDTIFFDHTTVEGMKSMSRRLTEAGRTLSENKHQMLKEHKDECHQRIQDVRQTHDDFWGRYRQERERRQQEYRDKIDGVLAKIESNISVNSERKSKAKEALFM